MRDTRYHAKKLRERYRFGFSFRGFLLRGFVAESVKSSAASTVLVARCSGLRLYDDRLPLRLIKIEAGTSSFRSARQQLANSIWIRCGTKR